MSKYHSLYYLNDRRVDAYVCIGSLGDGEKLRPAQGKVFRFLLEDGEIPYLKVWETNIVMITGVSAKIAEKLSD